MIDVLGTGAAVDRQSFHLAKAAASGSFGSARIPFGAASRAPISCLRCGVVFGPGPSRRSILTASATD